MCISVAIPSARAVEKPLRHKRTSQGVSTGSERFELAATLKSLPLAFPGGFGVASDEAALATSRLAAQMRLNIAPHEMQR